MNIFVTDACPVMSAQALDNVRVNKMILESAQMLSTAMSVNGAAPSSLPKSKAGNPFKPTHANHPCTKWVTDNRDNYWWLYLHLEALLFEYNHRTGKTHSCESTLSSLSIGYGMIPQVGTGLSEFQNSSGMDTGNVLTSYQDCMNAKWAKDVIKVKWTNRNPPAWITISVHQVGDVWYRS